MIKETYRNKFEFFKDNVIESNAVGQTLLALKDYVDYEYADEKVNLKKIAQAYMNFEDLVSRKIIKKLAIINKEAPVSLEIADGSSYDGSFSFSQPKVSYEGDYHNCSGSKVLTSSVFLKPADVIIGSESINGESLKINLHEETSSYNLTLKFSKEKSPNSGQCQNKASFAMNVQNGGYQWSLELNDKPTESAAKAGFDMNINIEAEEASPNALLSFEKNGNFCNNPCFVDLHGQAAEFLNENYYAEIDW